MFDENLKFKPMAKVLADQKADAPTIAAQLTRAYEMGRAAKAAELRKVLGPSHLTR